MRLALVGTALVLAFATAPAGADPYAVYYLDHTHAIQVGVYSPSSRATSDADPATVEVSLNLAKTDIALNSDPTAETPETGGCIDILIGSILDSGCGVLDIVPDGAMQTTHVSGSIESTAYDYVVDPFSMTERGPSHIVVDLTFAGTGDIATNASRVPVAAGTCGFPGVDTRGAFVIASLELTRPTVATGTLASDEAGAVDPAALRATMVDARGTFDGACAQVRR